MSRLQIEAEVGDIIAEELAKQKEALNQAERKQLVGDILDELLGLGPLEPLLKDPTITDILVNGHDQVFVERYGVLEPSLVRFKDEKHLLRIIQKIVSAVGRRIDESSPMVDARLADGSRVNAVVPPLALDGSLLSIRKFARVPISMDRLVEIGSIPAQVAQALRAIVGSRLNVLISGGTGSGKTTLLNAMSASIDGRERIVTIEDSAELQMQQEHVVRLETRPPNIEGKGEIAQRDLVKNALAHAPGPDHRRRGSRGRSIRHAPGNEYGSRRLDDHGACQYHPRRLSRVEQMIGMSGIDIPPKSSRAQIASAIHVVVQVARLADGRRKVVSVSELTGMEGEVITMQEIFRFRQSGVSNDGIVQGRFEATGIRPRFLDQMISHGITLAGRPIPARREVRVMSPIWIRALVLICTFGAVVLLAETLLRAYGSARTEGREINLRLRLIGRGRTTGETMNILRRTASSVPEGLPPFLDRMARKFERMLMQAQLTVSTGRLMLAVLIAPFAIFFGLLVLMSARWGIGINLGRIVISVAFALVLGAFLPLMVINFKATRTRKRMEEQFPVALDVFVRGLRAGHPIAAALELLTVEMPDPIGSQFGIVVDEVTYGAELRDALQNMAERWDLDDMRMFVVSLSIQNETGGNLAEILENLSRVIRERHSMLLKVRALSSEGRMTALMLTVLPVFTFVMLFIFNPHFFMDVADDPWFVPGFTVLIVLYAIGFFTIRKMVDLKV